MSAPLVITRPDGFGTRTITVNGTTYRLERRMSRMHGRDRRRYALSVGGALVAGFASYAAALAYLRRLAAIP